MTWKWVESATVYAVHDIFTHIEAIDLMLAIANGSINETDTAIWLRQCITS